MLMLVITNLLRIPYQNTMIIDDTLFPGSFESNFTRIGERMWESTAPLRYTLYSKSNDHTMTIFLDQGSVFVKDSNGNQGFRIQGMTEVTGIFAAGKWGSIVPSFSVGTDELERSQRMMRCQFEVDCLGRPHNMWIGGVKYSREKSFLNSQLMSSPSLYLPQ
jgi:hypothetical protein